MVSLMLVVLLSYLAGSIPTAIIAGRIVLNDDIRNHGSRNAGATNVFRVMGWKPALAVVLIDIGKGVAAVLLVPALVGGGYDPVLLKIIAGVAAIAGHIWTVFAGFKGGKGVGTAFGVLVSLAPAASLISFAVWLLLVLTTRIVSVGSLAAGVVFPLTLVLQKRFVTPELPGPLIWLGLFLGLLIFVTHRSNIRRLLRGEENRFGKKTGKSDPGEGE
ncbi:glycerol-3-phosphate 1-O-acyltransferase PlsY [bacterium]|nr:glycerol-3-phosphate 1-O-acyltransferase PlsY [bacterium]